MRTSLAKPLVLAAFAALFAVVGWSMRRQIATQVPVGSTFRLALGPDRLWIEGPAITGDSAYGTLRTVRLRGDVVLIRTAQTGQV